MIETDQHIKDLIPPQKAFELSVLPIRKEKERFVIGITDVKNLRVINEISFITGLKIIPEELPAEVILQKLKDIYPDQVNKGNGNNGYSKNTISDNSNIELVNQLISNAIKSSASDIHFEVYEKSFRVRYRIDGQLREILNLPSSRSLSIMSRIKIMADLDISEKRRPQDGRIKFSSNEKSIDIRVSSLPTSFGEKIVLRILDKSQLNLELDNIGIEKNHLERIKTNLKRPYGMILVTGPTGSGKTTTLYAALQFLHSIEKNIMTIEDPIEYNLPGINQSNVKADIGYTFANALRSFLRQDPDIVMVGEIRDRETAEIAIRASLTGHLVFSTLHTNDSISAVTRLIDMGIEPYLVANSVKLIMAQRLVRKLCDCKKSETKDKKLIFTKNGCENCGYTGYKGRTALFEIFEITEDISEMVSNNLSVSSIKKEAKNNGFKSLRDSGIEKINKGITSNEEVIRETML